VDLEEIRRIATGQHMVFVPTNTASKRTKNRLKEHGERGFVVRSTPRQSVSLFPTGEVIALFESITNNVSGKRTWLGWLPLSELKSIEGGI